LILLASAAYCVDIYPTVDFSFNSSTCEYSWTVNYTSATNVYFTALQVFSSLPSDSWTKESGAWSGSPAQDEGWIFTSPGNGDGTVALKWQGDATQQRKPINGAWTGVFKVVVPNSQPVAGTLWTYASTLKHLTQSTYVPQVVPEPSSALALGSLMGLIPIWLRKRN